MMPTAKTPAIMQSIISLPMSIPAPDEPVQEERGERGGDAEHSTNDDGFHEGFLSMAVIC